MSYETILVSTDEGVGVITLNRPEVLNALNFQLMSELDRAVTEMEDDEDVRAIILTGAGERAFSAGADIHENVELTEEEHRRRQEVRSQYQWHLATCRKPVIGAINGLCYGGATVMASSLDLRVGCEHTRFRFLAASYGQLNATWTLPLVVGWPMAKELLYTGREVYAEEAYRIGLLNHLVPSQQLLDKAMEIARLIARNYPASVQGIKHLLTQHLGMPWRQMWQQEMEARKTTYKGLTVQEGFKDFLARKGSPRKKKGRE